MCTGYGMVSQSLLSCLDVFVPEDVCLSRWVLSFVRVLHRTAPHRTLELFVWGPEQQFCAGHGKVPWVEDARGLHVLSCSLLGVCFVRALLYPMPIGNVGVARAEATSANRVSDCRRYLVSTST